MKFNKLSAEIQHDVFGNFSAQDLCKIVAPVCRRWRRFSYEPTLWTDVKLDGTEQSWSQMAQLLKRCFRIRRLELRGIENFSWLTNLSTFESVRELHLKTPCIISSEVMIKFLQLFPYVQMCHYDSTISFNNSHVNLIVQWSYLTCLTLAGDGTTGSLDIITEKCENLTTLCMNLINETEESLENFLKFRGHQLTSLYLYCLEHVSANTYQALSHCRRLFSLGLSIAHNFNDVNFVCLCELAELKRVVIQCTGHLFTAESFVLYDNKNFPPKENIYLSFRRSCNFNDTTLSSFFKCCPFRGVNCCLVENVQEEKFLRLARKSKRFDVRLKSASTAYLSLKK